VTVNGTLVTRLDVRGRTCPVPILMVTRGVSALLPGESLEVVADDPQFAEDVRAWCAHWGHTLAELETSAGVTTVSIVRGVR